MTSTSEGTHPTTGSPRRLGPWKVGPIGLGAAGFSVGAPPSEEQAIATVLAALDAGVTLIDTATAYTPSHELPGHNEEVIAKALRTAHRDDVIVATKAGLHRIAVGGTLQTDWTGDGRPEVIRQQCEISMRALGVDSIDLYQLHTPDPDVPLSETVGAFRELLDEGKIQAIGLCNVTVAQLEEALTITDVASVQNRFSPGARESMDVVEACERGDIAFLAYSPLGGLGDRARSLPEQHPAFAEIARHRGVSPQRIALAWELAVSPAIIPIPGSRRPDTIADSAAAATLDLTPDELERLAA